MFVYMYCVCLQFVTIRDFMYFEKRGGGLFHFLRSKTWVDFYDKLENKNKAYKELSCSENWIEVFVII